MTKNFLIFLAIGLVVVAAVVSFTWVGTKGAHLTLEGKVLKVRSVETDSTHSIVVVDFRVNNPTKTQFMAREGAISIVKADGTEVAGDTVARSDMNRVFDYYKLLGPKFNEILIARDRIQGGQIFDRMLAASFAIPASEVDQRKNIKVILTDIDGAAFSFSEH